MNKIELEIKKAFAKAIEEAFDYKVDADKINVELPKEENHGDYALNVAMQLAKPLKNSPVNIAKAILEKLDKESAGISSYEIAGPGFINLTMDNSLLTSIITKVIKKNQEFGSSDYGANEKYNVEFVSANPTGDLHPGHARGAAMGDAITRIMKFAGYQVDAEYYINDAGNQILNMAKSLQARYYQELGHDLEVPTDGYMGQDLVEIAKQMIKDYNDTLIDDDLDKHIQIFKDFGMKAELAKIAADLKQFRVSFDVWTSELSLYKDNMIEKTLAKLDEMAMTYESEGALWLKSTEFDDDKDRVLRKSDGSYTYLTPDIAYHLNKFQRGYSKLVDLLGADHHGYINRLKAGIRALGYNDQDLSVDIIQMVRLVKDNEEYKLSKRTGKALSLRDLMEETGVDALRYFFVSRAADTHMELNLDLAMSKTNENPVYYAQYAHARMCSILRNSDGFEKQETFELLGHPKEIALLKQINEFTNVVIDSAKSRQPHKICNYTQKLAALFHSFYGECKCLVDDKNLQNQRLALVKATQITLRNALELIGVEAVERM